MRNYEVAIIVHPEVDEQVLHSVVDKVKSWVTGTGGTAGEVEQWGKRRLAYPIRKQNEGHYVFVKAHMPPAATVDLERNLRLNEQVLRFMISSDEQ